MPDRKVRHFAFIEPRKRPYARFVGQIAMRTARKSPRIARNAANEARHDPITANGARWPAIFQADDCGYYGDPAATAETGRRMLAATIAGLARFIAECAATPLRAGIAPDPGAARIDRLREPGSPGPEC